MRRSAPQRFAATAVTVALTAALLSARAADDVPSNPPFDPLGPEVTSPSFGEGQGKSLKAAGIALYVAGAVYDLYTTKRAIYAGLSESNPLLRSSGNPNRTLLTAAVAKIGVGFVIGSAGRRGGDHARGAWFVSCGVLQIGVGVANRSATIWEREATPVPPPPTTAAQPVPGTPPSDGKAILATRDSS
jgi:hypothetical protein